MKTKLSFVSCLIALLAFLPDMLRAEVTATDVTTLDYAVYTSKVSVSADSEVALSVCLKNEQPIATWQADLELPKGFTIAQNEFGDLMIVVSGTRTSQSRHSIATNTLENGMVRFLYNSASNFTIQGTDGEVATLTLHVSADVEPGEYPIVFRNIVMSEANQTGHKVDAVTSILTVGDDNPTYDEGYAVQIAPFTLTEDREDIAICLVNATPLKDVAFDMALPKAFLDIEGYNISLGTETGSTKKYACDVEDCGNGTVHVTCSRKNTNILAKDCGNILNLGLWFEDEDGNPVNKAGVYELALKNIVLTDTEDEKYVAAPYTTSFFIGDLSTISEVPALYGDYTAEGVEAFNTAFGENKVAASFDFTNATGFDAETALAPGNKNALFYASEDAVPANDNVIVGGVCNNLVLTDGQPFSASTAFKAEAVTYERTLTAGAYGTVVLPFTPNEETAKAYSFYTFTGMSNGKMNFDEVTTPAANTPYIVINNGGVTKMTAANVEVATTDAKTTVDEMSMVGTYEQQIFTEGLEELYYISSNKFMQATKQLTMNPFRAYFQGKGAVGSINLRDADGSTRIISLEQDAQDASTLYDLFGRSVENAEKGIYIVNGQKVLIK